ncbi:MAG: FAD binding domain-containing protein, partial [Syntrophorhabdaceae bacterium]|nr:FAD binding domain-containing protein [Syntrophorhabdaceae bacterium]
MKGYEYYKPKSIEEAIKLMGSLDGAQYIAGGTDVMVMLRQKKIAPRCMISLRNITDLSHIDTREGLRIGSAATHSAIEGDEYIKQRYSALNDATTHLGSRQIRNVATIGGNICNAAPSADTACPLLVLDARAIIVGPKGSRELDLDDFF